MVFADYFTKSSTNTSARILQNRCNLQRQFSFFCHFSVNFQSNFDFFLVFLKFFRVKFNFSRSNSKKWVSRLFTHKKHNSERFLLNIFVNFPKLSPRNYIHIVFSALIHTVFRGFCQKSGVEAGQFRNLECRRRFGSDSQFFYEFSISFFLFNLVETEFKPLFSRTIWVWIRFLLRFKIGQSQNR